MKILTLLYFLFVCFLYSCSSRQESLQNDLKDVVVKTEKNYENFSENDWESNNKRIVTITKEFYKNRSSYSPAQIKEINKLIGCYQALQLKQGINLFQNALGDFKQQLEGATEVLDTTTTTTNQDNL